MRKNLNLVYKKGNTVSDTILVFIVLFGLGLISFLVYNVFDDIKPQIQEGITDPTANATLNESYDRYPATFDSIFLIVLVLMWGMTLVASFMIDTHPIFFIFAVILLIFVIFAVIILGNAYTEITEDTAFGSTADSFPMTQFFFSNIIPFSIVIAFSIALVLYIKFQGGGPG